MAFGHGQLIDNLSESDAITFVKESKHGYVVKKSRITRHGMFSPKESG
jgi:hypothetical protein